MKPLVEGLEKQYGSAIDMRRLNVGGSDQSAMSLADKLGVQYVPTFVYVTKDGVVSQTFVGEKTAAELQAGLDAIR
jgi:thioredoxin-like negative regulator of GroEL